MDMHTQDAGHRIIDPLFHTGGDPVTLFNRQFSIDANSQIHDDVRAEPVGLQFLQLFDAL